MSQRIMFEGCEVIAIAPEDLAAIERERDLLRRQVEVYIRFVRQSPCTCEPLHDDDPDGPKFGPSCDRCRLIELEEGRRT